MTKRPELRPREAHKRDKHDRIRAAAWELFTKAGYAETTTRDVAQRAGVATGTLFLYATDKPDLLFLVFHDRLSETVEEGLSTVNRKAHVVEQVAHVFDRLFAMYGEHPALARRFVAELPGGAGPNADKVNALTAAFVQRMSALVAAAQDRGEIDAGVAPVHAASVIFGLYFATLMAWLSGAVTLDGLPAMLRASLGLMMRGLAPRK
jgi:AcrR family transcriptional regulator